MIKKALDKKYSYQIDEHGIVHLFRGEEDCQQLLTNPLISAIFKIEKLEAQTEKMKNCFNCAKGNWENRIKCIESGCVNKSKWELKEK